MDIQHLVDRLEDLIDEGRHVFGTKFTMMDEERALELIDQMRISIPEEIEKAARILAERERVLAEAHEEAGRIIQQARARGERLIDQESAVQSAQTRAAHIIEKARQEALNITGEADQYVMQTLAQLEQQLVKNLTVVRNGINEVNHPSSVPPQQVSPPAQFPTPAQLETVDVANVPIEGEQKK